jgi:hypothetical protein
MSGLLVALAAGAWLAACTTGDVAMNPSVTTETTPVERSLGFYLSEAFETDVREVALRGQGYIAKFPLGQASAALFRNLIPRLSAGAVEVAATRSDAAVDAVIEPVIDDFVFWTMRIGGQHFWVKVRYRFNLYAPAGELITGWTVEGSGEGAGMGEAADQAVEQSAARFAASFRQMPEARRWLDGLPLAAATAAAELQKTEPAMGLAPRTGVYDGAVRVRVEPEPAGWRDLMEALAAEQDARPVRLTALALRIENLGASRLLVRPSDIALTDDGGAPPLEPLPHSAVAAVLTEQHGRIASPAAGAGLLALPLLIAALANLASASEELTDFEARSATLVAQHLRETIVVPGEAVEGLVYFPAARPKLRGLMIEIPVVDLDGATRYVVRVPAGEPTASFKPFTAEQDPAEEKTQ